MADQAAKSSYWRGLRDGLPFILVVAPFAMLFGVAATEAGLSIAETLAFSFVVIAGTAQFTALTLLMENAPAIVALASALAVNMRVAMYSASITPHLGALPLWQRALAAYCLVDQNYASSVLEYERRPGMTLGEKFGFFLGVTTAIIPFWYIFTWVGAELGAAIPAELGLDFALPIAFTAMIAPALRTRAHIAAAFVAATTALAFAWLPWNFGLMVGGLAGMLTGAEVERRTGEALT